MESEDRPVFTNSEIKKINDFDVFLWANEIDEVKNNVSCELFLFNKNYTPFKIRYSEKLTNSVKQMFMGEAVAFVIKEADKGLECREYEKSDGENKVIYRTDLDKVIRAESLIRLVEKEYKDMKLTIKDDNEFLKLKMPKDIKRLKTVSDFFAEGTVQSNCVFSYIPYVNKGKCMIYTMMKDDKKYTIEIVKNKKGYQLRQLSGFANSPAPTDVVEYVSNVIYENNKRLGYKGDNLTQYII